MSAGSKKVIIAALVGNGLIAVTKFVAAAVTQSSAMFSEAIHSVVDTGNQLLLLYGLRRAARPPDADFPFGYGKEVYFWSFVVAILIFAVGAGLSIYEGVLHMLHPSEIHNPLVNYIVLGVALIFEGAAWYLAVVEFAKVKGGRSYFRAVRKAKDPSIFVVLFEDSAAMLGLAAAFLGIYLAEITGLSYLDGLASIFIGCILGGTAVWLAFETKGLLIGESAGDQVVRGIRGLAARQEGIHHVNEVLTLHMGPDFVLVNISVDFSDESTAQDVERIVSELDWHIKQAYPVVKRVFVEAEARRATNTAASGNGAART